MSILVNKHTRVITQGITGKAGRIHTAACRAYGNGRHCFVAGVNPNKPGASVDGIPIFATVREARAETGATVSVIYVPPAFAAAAIDEAVDAGLELVICITEGIPVRDMIRTRRRMRGQRDGAARPQLSRASSRPRRSRSASCRATSTSAAASAWCRAPARWATRP